MLITNNHVSFARKGKIAQISKKVSKYYGHNCSWTGFVFDLEDTLSCGIRNSATFRCH